MIYEKKDTTALITINRPKALNAFNSQMLDELTEALEMAEKDTGVRCVILTAAGERAFTAGGDIKEEVQLNETTAAEFSRRGKKMIRSILNHRVPVICAVRGYALGGGMEMILWQPRTRRSESRRSSSVGFRDGAVQSFFRERSALPEPRSFYIRGAASLWRKR